MFRLACNHLVGVSRSPETNHKSTYGMINFSYIVITVILMSSVSCSVYNDVQITKDKTVNFDQYESYAWLPDQESKKQSDFNNDFIRQKTRNYFGHCMAQRQLTPDTINPDLLLQEL